MTDQLFSKTDTSFTEAPDDFISGLLCVVSAVRLSLGAQELYTAGEHPGCVLFIAPSGGAVQVTCRDSRWRLNDGDLLALRGGNMISVLPEDAVSVTVITLRGSAADAFLSRGAVLYPSGGNAAAGLTAISDESADGLSAAAAASCRAYHMLMRLHCSGSAETAEEKRLPRVVEAAIGIMQEEFALLDGIGELAERLEVSQEYLTRVFSATLGITPAKYLVRVRVEYAKLLLRQGGHHVSFVSDACGFANANYFARVFRNLTGMSPATYARTTDTLPPLETLPDSFYVL